MTIVATAGGCRTTAGAPNGGLTTQVKPAETSVVSSRPAWPPLVAVVTILLGRLFDALVPIGLVAQIPERTSLTLLFAVVAATLAISAVVAFRRADVSVVHGTPRRLVTDGVLAHTRHPMYLGTILGLIALALSFGSDWLLVFLVPAALVVHRIVLGEERVLQAAFGDEYRRYAARVPRYGWRF